jgi:AraC family transcriptional regulator, exoenzyme S synthesis regulatory protein ExsA
MSSGTDPLIPKIVYACVSKRVVEGELFISQHVIEYILSGSSEVYFGGKRTVHQAGDIRLAVKNRLSKFVKLPRNNDEFRSVVICIDDATLLELSAPHQRSIAASQHYDNVIKLRPHQLFNNYFDSLMPYLQHGHQLSNELVKTKVKEAVLIFLQANPDLKNLLFDFSEPGKIDLQAFMEEHYQYSGDLAHMAYLTGRSISTFKRDFKKIFHTTPSKWLIQKKLEAAHHLLKEKGMKPTDVYMEVGFNDYSHFFVAFKKLFGVAPSML